MTEAGAGGQRRGGTQPHTNTSDSGAAAAPHSHVLDRGALDGRRGQVVAGHAAPLQLAHGLAEEGLSLVHLR